MYVEQLDLNPTDNPFDRFSLEFLTLMEKSNYWVTVHLLVSVISNIESLKHFVNGLDDSDVKEKLLRITEYDANYYSKIVASLLAKLNLLNDRKAGINMETQIEQPSIHDVKALNGKDFAMLNNEEKAVYEFYWQQGRKFGVSLKTISDAPKEELERANSKQQYDEIVSRYPSSISVEVA